MSWGNFMMLNCIPICLFSVEISFAPLKLDLKVKRRGRRSGGMCEVAVFKNIKIRVSAFSLKDCAVCSTDNRRAISFASWLGFF